ncbi:hypothetical protein BJY00DRAFT_4270 [Aspergillus carlsbadensis]|nr:hypothetical protein BJY00DRAFT_4270 [Aspergillus carlsbadensis]
MSSVAAMLICLLPLHRSKFAPCIIHVRRRKPAWTIDQLGTFAVRSWLCLYFRSLDCTTATPAVARSMDSWTADSPHHVVVLSKQDKHFCKRVTPTRMQLDKTRGHGVDRARHVPSKIL